MYALEQEAKNTGEEKVFPNNYLLEQKYVLVQGYCTRDQSKDSSAFATRFPYRFPEQS
jgi:hypothetical protein